MDKWREELITNNTKLIYFCYNRYMLKTKFVKDHYNELLGEGTVGLCKAAKTYNPECGVAFSSFAVRCILNQMRMYIRDDKGKYNLTDSLEKMVPGTTTVTIADTITNHSNIDDRVLLNQVYHYLNKTQKPRDVEMFVLWLQGTSHEEIGKTFNVSKAYVNKILHRLKKDIKQYFKK